MPELIEFVIFLFVMAVFIGAVYIGIRKIKK